MERITINVARRNEIGKGAARSLRRNNLVPAVLYREGKSLLIKLDKKEITRLINETAGEQVMLNLKFSDGENKLALLKDIQIDPLKRELIHADFFEVSLEEKVRVSAHISLMGEPVGVKRDKGILQHLLREIEIECLPDKIPGHITVDISGLEIGQSLNVGALNLGEDVKILTPHDEVIANVTPPIVEEVAPVEAAAPEVVEPEVVKKGKKEEEETEEGK
ncbi:MAG: 50S ribosomal protein L25 [Nitrospirota bacterium]